jgi:hypothetical protein
MDKNCLQHSQHNEAVKAYKVACLAYKPGPVVFEDVTYTRKDLLEAQHKLAEICLDKLSHLNLANVDYDRFTKEDPRHVPALPRNYTDGFSPKNRYRDLETQRAVKNRMNTMSVELCTTRNSSQFMRTF